MDGAIAPVGGGVTTPSPTAACGVRPHWQTPCLSGARMPNEATTNTDPKPPKRLLLVDDEDAIVIPMAGYFRRLGCFVSTTGSPDEAIAALRAEPYDLCLLDLRLKPFDFGGLDVVSFLRTTRPSTPVIILSANVSAEAEEEARRLGVRAILRKPQPLAHVAHRALALMKVRRHAD